MEDCQELPGVRRRNRRYSDDTVAVYSRWLRPPGSRFFLFGLRGAGKTTWARGHFPGARHFDLLQQSVYQDYLADPRLFRRERADVESAAWVVVDEIQRLPWLLDEIHGPIEKRKLRFVLLGSSARKLGREGTDLPGGRAL
jgi:predicted AAA+ superfamily ATPase